MLVLTRCLGQTNTPGDPKIIGDPANPDAAIEIIIIEVRGDQVRLGIKAPHDVSVDRTEMREQKNQNAHGQ